MSGSKIKVTAEGSLIIDKVNKNDFGYYACQASNLNLNVTETMMTYLDVECKIY